MCNSLERFLGIWTAVNEPENIAMKVFTSRKPRDVKGGDWVGSKFLNRMQVAVACQKPGYAHGAIEKPEYDLFFLK